VSEVLVKKVLDLSNLAHRVRLFFSYILAIPYNSLTETHTLHVERRVTEGWNIETKK